MSTDAQLLSVLRGNVAEFTSLAELCRRLGLSAPVINGRIEALRQLGYHIEFSPHLGCRLVAVPDVLHADDLLTRLGEARIVGRDIRVFQETTSTNDVVEKLARDGVEEGVAVFAETQTKGRGRLGRTWVSPAGKGLWFSVLLRPTFPPPQATQITVAGATALVRALQRVTGLTADIKWPNDLLLRGRKVAGILTEMSAEAERIHHVTLGIGLDVNQAEADFPPEVRRQATSLRIETGRDIARAELAAAVLNELDRDYRRLTQGAFAVVADEWEARCTTIGQDVCVLSGDRRIRGRAEALDDDGALLLRTEHGRLERILGGDVTLEKRAT